LIGHVIIGDALGESTGQRVSAGVCFPRARVTPKIKKASPWCVADWIRDSDDKKFSTEEFLAAVNDPAKLEPIMAESGPPLAGMGNFQRWGLAVDPYQGLVRV
jgi:hypothetical protein